MVWDTIFALATARGKAGVAIIRVSGPSARSGCARIVPNLPDHRRPVVRQIFDLKGKKIDEALVLVFLEHQSFTGEETVELHIHGAPAVISAVEKALSEVPDFRPAEAGEFTRRALQNDRIDLSQVEALADLIDAETEAQRVQAQRMMDGALTEKVNAWRKDLIEAVALVEATIDFADEDVPVDVSDDVCELLRRVRAQLCEEIDGSHIAERVRDGFEVAIIGNPNAGKSTLVNAIAKRQVALTSPIAGTTRDVLEVRIDLDGLAVTFLDTAGLHETSDILEAQGVALAEERAEGADLRVHLLVSSNEERHALLRADDIAILGKSDAHKGCEHGVSGLSGVGVERLLEDIAEILKGRMARVASATNARHRRVLLRSKADLDEALRSYDLSTGSELLAQNIRDALTELHDLIGRVDADEILGDVFSRFCIGK